MRNSTSNFFSRGGVFGALCATALFLSAGSQARAQDYCTTYSGTLSFHGSIVGACPLLDRGDSAEIFVGLHDCITFLARVNLGEYAFSAVTSAGVAVTGTGTLILDQLHGVLKVTAIIVGDPAGEHYDYTNLKFHVGLDRTGLAGAVLTAASISLGSFFSPPYEGALTLPRDLIAECPLLQKGDKLALQFWSYGWASYDHQQKTDLGVVTFTAFTPSGVPVGVVGTLYGTSDQAVLTVTQLTISDSLGDHCLSDKLALTVNVKVHWPHHRVVVN